MAQPAWGGTNPPTTTDPYAGQFATGAPLPSGQKWGTPDAAGANTGWEGMYGGQSAADKSAADRASIEAYERAMKAGAPQQEVNTSGTFGHGGIIASAQQPAKTAPAAPAAGIIGTARAPTIRQTLDGLQWTPETERDSAGKLWNAAQVNGWNSADIGKEVGWDAQTVDALFGKYGYGKTPGTLSPGQPMPSGAAQLGNPTTWDIDKDQTVEGRIAGIVGDRNNPLQVIARNNAMEQSAARGLVNSAMAASAGEKAAFDAALPIAQSDAATYAKAAGYNADMRNQFAKSNVDADNQFRLQDKQIGAEKDIALINRETQRQITTLNADLQKDADKIATDNKVLLETNQQASGIMNQAVSAVSAIQNNANMDGATKTQAIANIWRDVQTQLRVIGGVAGLDLVKDLNFANYPGFDAAGNYVGFGGGAASTEGPPGVSLDAKMPDGRTVGQAYEQYKAGGGNLSISDWYAIVAPQPAVGVGNEVAGR